jgi:hypothetical protein
MNLCAPYSELFSTKEIECETEHKWKAGFYHCTETPECILLLNIITNAGKKNKNNTTIIRNTQIARNINVIVDCREKRHKYLLESLQSRMMISDYLTTECKSLMGMKTS